MTAPTKHKRLTFTAPVPIFPEALATMRERGGPWAAYECHALDSSLAGSLRFLSYGMPESTFQVPPERWPGEGPVAWSFVYVGEVDLEQGEVVS